MSSRILWEPVSQVPRKYPTLVLGVPLGCLQAEMVHPSHMSDSHRGLDGISRDPWPKDSPLNPADHATDTLVSHVYGLKTAGITGHI